MTRLNLEFNDLTDLPDLSGMSWLKRAYFEGNRIAADKITEEKLPAALLTQTPDWVADTVSQQCGDISAVFAPRYYAMGDTVSCQSVRSEKGFRQKISPDALHR